MIPRALIPLLLAAALAPTRAHATEEADAYCTWVRAAARSQGALLLSPQLYFNGGYVNGDAALTGGTTGVTGARVTAGLRYSLSEIYQGALVRTRAKADCERFRSVSELNAVLESARELQSRRALTAKVAVLQEALPRAAQILKVMETQTADGRATVEQLNATALRVDGLRAQLAEARQLLAIAESRPEPPKGSLKDLQRQRADAEGMLERTEGRLRRAQGWDLMVRGGYDRLFGVRDQLPLFGIVSVTFNPAWLWQWSADKEAVEARRRWSRLDSAGGDERVALVMRQFTAMETSERARLDEARQLLTDLEHRWKAVEALEGPRAQSFRDYLWFDLIKLRAEVAYLDAHVGELAAYRGGGS